MQLLRELTDKLVSYAPRSKRQVRIGLPDGTQVEIAKVKLVGNTIVLQAADAREGRVIVYTRGRTN